MHLAANWLAVHFELALFLVNPLAVMMLGCPASPAKQAASSLSLPTSTRYPTHLLSSWFKSPLPKPLPILGTRAPYPIMLRTFSLGGHISPTVGAFPAIFPVLCSSLFLTSCSRGRQPSCNENTTRQPCATIQKSFSQLLARWMNRRTALLFCSLETAKPQTKGRGISGSPSLVPFAVASHVCAK